MKTYRPLETINLGDTKTHVYPDHPTVDLDSEALHFMTDFLKVHAVVVADTMEVDEALRIMKESHVRLLLVNHEDEFAGIVTATDINGGKVLAYMGANQVRQRDEVIVRNVMTDREHIHGLDYLAVSKACIGDVLETIKNINEQHVLVIENKEGEWGVRGLFSTTDIVRALRINFDVEPHAKTFFELEQVILQNVRH